jgi:diguanylate cyclase (GGDEF)-like protein
MRKRNVARQKPSPKKGSKAVPAIENKLLTILEDSGPAGLVVRSLLPWSIGIFLLLAGLHFIAEQQGLYSRDVGNLLFAVANITALAGLIWRAGHQLLRSDIERRNAEIELRRRATHDRLTGLPNRGAFIDYLKDRMEIAKQMPTPGFAVLYMDLDGFKIVNDRLGHQTGDRLLANAAELISKSVRRTDLVSRIGGDEFTVLLDEITAPHEVERIAQRIINAFSRNISVRDGNVHVGISIGAAIYSDHHHTQEHILEDADTALYQAKSLGKGRYAIANSTADTFWLDC